MLDINHLRKDYHLKSLDINNLNQDPFFQFHIWFREAEQAQIPELNAMSLATVSTEGRPSCRTVLLKGLNAKGFLFYTHYTSRKGRELEQNPFASVVFYWKALERQVIIEGNVERLEHEVSENYFHSRPRGSQLGAWASHQDQKISSREELETAYQYYQELFHGQLIPLPPYWGGYCLIPQRFEFWQGRVDRLHDRFQYQQRTEGWHIDRLSP